MEYQALYRRYRPKNFDQIIGQKHITDVLKNQIATNQVSHAYLFSGSRGTGKTSTAKIFARAVNCENTTDGEPCLTCPACLESMGESVDIIELDAASNNRVDDVRALIEKAVFTPIHLKKKVYIIDEAHMLTQQAFNALLKTLEEPPAHILFILATTEPQKILPTIVSRCQRFDFRRLTVSDIVSCLEDVLNQAGAEIERDGLISIARKANGGMRDALSLADQCLSLCGTHVSSADVHHVLGNVDTEFLFDFADAIIASDAPRALRMLDEVCQGRDISQFLQDVTAHFRALLLASMGGDCADILDCTQEDMAMYQKQASTSNVHRLMRTVDIFANAQSKTKLFKNPRPLVEVETIRAMNPEIEGSMDALLDRIATLESRPVVQMQEKAPEPVKPKKQESAPKEKPKPVQKSSNGQDAQKIYDEAVAALVQSKPAGEGMFMKISLKKATGVSISNGALTASFADKTHYDNTQSHRAELENILLEKGYDLKFSVLMTKNAAADDMETALQNAFEGDIEFVD